MNDFKKTRKIYSKFCNDFKSITHYKDLKKQLLKNIFSSVKIYKNKKTLNLMSEISIDSLYGLNLHVKISRLKLNGINNLKILYQISYADLCQIGGIGLKSAQLVKNIVNKKYNILYEQEDIGDDLLLKKDETVNILKELYRYLFLSSKLDYLEKLASNIYNSFNKKTLKTKTNVFTWLFSSRKNKISFNLLIDKIENYFLSENYSLFSKELISIRKSLLVPLIEKENDFWNKDTIIKFVIKYFKKNTYTVGSEQKIGHSLTCPKLSIGDSFLKVEKNIVENDIEKGNLNFSYHCSCNLQKHQEAALEYFLNNKTIILSDDPGFGKRIVAIAGVIKLINCGKKKILIITDEIKKSYWSSIILRNTDFKSVYLCKKNENNLITNEGSMIFIGTIKNLPLFYKESEIDMLIIDEDFDDTRLSGKKNCFLKKIFVKSSYLFLIFDVDLYKLRNQYSYILGLLHLKNRSIQTNLDSENNDFCKFVLKKFMLRRSYEEINLNENLMLPCPIKVELLEDERKAYEELVLKCQGDNVFEKIFDLASATNQSKLKTIVEFINKKLKLDEKIVVFTSVKNNLKIINKLYDEKCVLVENKISSEEINNIIQFFSSDNKKRILICQTKYVQLLPDMKINVTFIYCDPQLDLIKEKISISKIFNICERNKVFVYHFLRYDTLDENVYSLSLLNPHNKFPNIFKISLNSIFNILDLEKYKISKNNLIGISEKDAYFTETDDYYYKLMDFDYFPLVNFLVNKYGYVNSDYFKNDDCLERCETLNNGLFIHHIDEYSIPGLSNYDIAIKNDFSHQKSERLVYCNLLEHLILHYKILIENPDFIYIKNNGFNLLMKQINDFYEDGILYDTRNTRSYYLISNNLLFFKYIKSISYYFEPI